MHFIRVTLLFSWSMCGVLWCFALLKRSRCICFDVYIHGMEMHLPSRIRANAWSLYGAFGSFIFNAHLAIHPLASLEGLSVSLQRDVLPLTNYATFFPRASDPDALVRAVITFISQHHGLFVSSFSVNCGYVSSRTQHR